MGIQTSEAFKLDGEGGVEEMKGEEQVEGRHVRTCSVDVPVKRAPVIEEMTLNEARHEEKFIEVIEGKDCNHPTAGEGLIDAVSAFVLNFKAAVSALRGEERIHELWKAKIALKFLQSLCGKSGKSSTQVGQHRWTI
jgi:hypothetical protein